MSLTGRILLWCSLSLALGCGGSDTGSSSSTSALAVAAEADANAGDPEDEDGDPAVDEGNVGPGELECPRGGKTGPIRVAFDCDEIVVVTCKDLSNVVLEYEDGTRERYEDLNGNENAFAGSGENEGKVIVGVWVKSGANHSGDGPGYGERFDAPEDSCGDPGGDGDGDGSEAPKPPGKAPPPPTDENAVLI